MIDLEAVRRELPVTARTAYLNTGTAGPWPSPVVAAVEGALRREQALGRESPRGLPDFAPTMAETRELLARWIGANASEIALTTSTTAGVNIAAWGHPYHAGEELLTTSIEHRGVLLPLHQLARRNALLVHIADVGNGEPDQVLAALEQAITRKTRLVAVSHVSFSTGARLPLAEIAQLAHAAGAALLVDGAQAVGAIPVDVNALNVDYYAFPGQKWLLGPEGTGALYVRHARQSRLESTFVGTHSAHPDAGRFEYTTVFRPGIHGLHAALRWLEQIGAEAIFARIAELAGYCAERLGALPGATVVTPSSARAGLVNVRLQRADLEACVARAAEAGLAIRGVDETRTLRVSCGFFNTQAEIDRLVEVLSRALEER